MAKHRRIHCGITVLNLCKQLESQIKINTQSRAKKHGRWCRLIQTVWTTTASTVTILRCRKVYIIKQIIKKRVKRRKQTRRNDTTQHNTSEHTASTQYLPMRRFKLSRFSTCRTIFKPNKGQLNIINKSNYINRPTDQTTHTHTHTIVCKTTRKKQHE